MMDERKIDVVLGKRGRVVPESQLFQPVLDYHVDALLRPPSSIHQVDGWVCLRAAGSIAAHGRTRAALPAGDRRSGTPRTGARGSPRPAIRVALPARPTPPHTTLFAAPVLRWLRPWLRSRSGRGRERNQ